jgi:hypothetical protein
MDRGLRDGLVARVHRAVDPLHSLVYFAPETEERLTEAGLRPGRMCYFAGRAAALGAVGAGVVTATFYNFSPALVARHIPRAWGLASPRPVLDARLAAADAALRRLLGDAVGSPEVHEAADLARTATQGCAPEGRPLYAGHAEVGWPDEPHLVLWHAVTLLREHRGDGHIAVLARAGLSGLEALVTHTATGRGFTEAAAKATRGWTDEEWDEVVRGLRERGLLDAEGALTETGSGLRRDVEAETDALAEQPWRQLGEEGTERLAEIGRALSRRAAEAGAFPADLFASR